MASKLKLLHAFPQENLEIDYDVFPSVGVCESQTAMDLLALFSLYCIPNSLNQIFDIKDTPAAVDVSCDTWMMTAAVQKVG